MKENLGSQPGDSRELHSSKKAELAKALFHKGANCAQAVLGAFAEECGLTEEEAFRIASGFGGGISRLREVCGAVSGMVLTANFLCGQSDITDKAEKDSHYSRIRELTDSFQAELGSVVCRVLLGLEKQQSDSPVSETRTAEYYRKRPCSEIVALAAAILERKFLISKEKN